MGGRTPRSRELTVGLRQQGQSDPPFGISDVLRVTACPEQEYERLMLVQTADPAVLERFLLAAWQLLINYGDQFLAGSPHAFDQARADRSRRAASYTASIDDAPILRAADEAWHDGDMSAVVTRLQPLQARLSKRDQRRLAYALRRLGGERDREGR